MNRGRAWCGTWNNYPEGWKECFKGFSKYTAQLEQGEQAEQGVFHVQWCGYCEHMKSFEQIKAMLEGAHIEKAKNWNACVNYCKKEKTAVEGSRISNEFVREEVLDPLEGKELRPIQNAIIEIIEGEREGRLIHWFYDPKGGAGKTSLAKHICMSRDDAIYLGGKSADMKYGVMKWLEKHNLRVVFINLTKTVENFVSYAGIEEVKDGIFFNTKYECEMIKYNPPHIIVLANFLPEFNKLIADRWRIYNGKGERIDNKQWVYIEDRPY